MRGQLKEFDGTVCSRNTIVHVPVDSRGYEVHQQMRRMVDGVHPLRGFVRSE
jgi:hypothetical protein